MKCDFKFYHHMCNHRNGNLFLKNPHEREISWNLPCPRAIHLNGQILIFQVPYKYTKNSLRGC